jgi:hypothetical protein
MNKIVSIQLGIILISFSSCINEKYIFKSNRLYATQSIAANPTGTTPTSETNNLLIYKPDSSFKAIITDKGDYLLVNPIKKMSALKIPDKKIQLKTAPVSWRAENVGKLYFPESDYDTSENVPFRFKYLDTKPVLQALTIPLKIRPKLNSEALRDSFPSQAETSFNVGVAFGWKFTTNVYNAKKNIFGQNTNRYSLSPGLFLGAGATDLKKVNTRNPKIAFERKAAMITTGGFIMVGINTINLGYAFGADFSTGIGNKQWLYQGKIWHGIIFAIDIIK